MEYEVHGPATIGTIGEKVKVVGYAEFMCSSNTVTLTGLHSTAIGGTSSTITLSGSGSTVLSGSSLTTTVGGNGCVSVCASGTLGTSTTHTNIIVIGGSNTTVTSSGVVCIGPSSESMQLQPSIAKMYIKDNPIMVASTTALTTPGIISPSALSGGYVQFTTTPGTYTFDTVSNIRNAILDSSGSAFSSSPYFDVTFQNTTGGSVLLTAGTGQTFTNGSPYTLFAGRTQTLTFRFVTTTTMTVETPTAIEAGTGIAVSSPLGNVVISSIIGTTGFFAAFTANVALSADAIITGAWSDSGSGRWNLGNNFNTTTGIYTVPADGLYNISYQMSSNGSLVGNSVSLQLSGTNVYTSGCGVLNTPCIGGTVVLSLTTGQTLNLITQLAATVYYRYANTAGYDGGTFFSVFRMT